MNVDEIMAVLSTLTPTDLDTIRTKCSYLLNKLPSQQSGNTTATTPFIEMLYLHLRSCGHKCGLLNFPTMDQLGQKKPGTLKDFITKAQEVEQWFTTSFGKDIPNTYLRDQMIHMLIRRYIKHLSCSFTTINPWNLIACINYIPQVFEQEFPEYIANNLQKIVINQLLEDK